MRTALIIAGGFVLWGICVGIAKYMAGASATGTTAATVIFVAVFLHKLPEGFTVASVVLASGQGKRNAILAAGLLGVATVAGVPHAASAKHSATAAAAVSNRMPEYLVSICFMEGTPLPIFIAFSGAKRKRNPRYFGADLTRRAGLAGRAAAFPRGFPSLNEP